MNFKKRIAETSPGFQMAPMLDIVFILLVHFMAATLFAKWENKLDITVPSADSSMSASRQRMEIIVNVDKNGAIFINSIELKAERLEEILATTHARSPELPVIIRADQDARHKDVIRVLDICAKADVRNVAFSTITPQEQGK
ncbi:MAG: biopolymer transporter ExbD [Victivallales bacterium]|nr:biopolymer transporter ExbD [Victivallales bacterium]MBQ7175873.1 biopolymer transporter ExbD [Victivallales bacterium]